MTAASHPFSLESSAAGKAQNYFKIITEEYIAFLQKLVNRSPREYGSIRFSTGRQLGCGAIWRRSLELR
jgi:hypothetical protein